MVSIWFVVGFALFSFVGQFLTYKTALSKTNDDVPKNLYFLASMMFLVWPFVYFGCYINEKKAKEK